jgi:uncharacterized membrane protein
MFKAAVTRVRALTRYRLKIPKMELYDFVVLGAIVVYGLVFSFFTLLKHDVFQSYAWDLGIFDQSLFSTLHGHFLYYTAELFLNPTGCLFAEHISPILLLILPFYAIQPSATTLLVLKSFVLALGALPLYLVACKVLHNKKTGLLLALIYLLYPPLQGANWFDFQPQVFLPLFIFSAYYFITVKRWKPYFLAVLLALMIEEHISIVVFVLSAYVLLSHRKILVTALKNFQMNEAVASMVTMVLCVIWFFSALYVKGTFPINPQFAVRYQASDTFSVLGLKGNPLSLPVYVLSNPQNIWNALMFDYPIKFLYIILLFGPLIFLPFKSKLCIGVLLLLAPFLLSNYWPYYTIGAHYPLYVLPLIFLSAVEALKQFHPSIHLPILKIALMVTIVFIASTSPISPISSPFGVQGLHILWYPNVNLSPTQDTESLNTQLQLIPSSASILTQNHIFPHVSNRLDAYVIPPIGHFENDTVYLADLMKKSDYILLDMWGWDSLTQTVFDMATKNSSYGVYALGSKSLLLKEGYQGTPMFSHYTEQRFFQDYKYLTVLSGQTMPDADSKSGTVALFPKGFEGLGARGPYTYLLPGTYNITFMIKVENNSNEQVATLGVAYNDYKFTTVTTREINGSELNPNVWTNVTLTVNFSEVVPNIEFLTWVNGVTNIYEDGVIVTKVSN